MLKVCGKLKVLASTKPKFDVLGGQKKFVQSVKWFCTSGRKKQHLPAVLQDVWVCKHAARSALHFPQVVVQWVQTFHPIYKLDSKLCTLQGFQFISEIMQSERDKLQQSVPQQQHHSFKTRQRTY